MRTETKALQKKGIIPNSLRNPKILVGYTPSHWKSEKALAIRSWIGSPLLMIRGRFLSAKERTALQAVMRHPSETHGVARRANAILLLDDGLSCADVAKVLYLDDDTVRTWFKRYQAGGLDEMKVFDWKGRSGDLSREQMAELSARLGERLMRDSGEVAAYIAARWGVVYSPSGCVALLHRLGFEYKRPESLPARADEAKQAAFISRYDQLLNGLAADEVVYFADAVHPEYQSRPAHGWVRKGDKVALRRTSGRQRLNLHAALNLENFHCPLVEGGRADRCRLHHRAAREVGGQQPRQEADLRHRRQRPLSSRPCGPAVAGETRLPHHARLPARLCTPSQRHREVMGCHAPRSDPQQVPSQLRALRRRLSSISSADDCHKSGQNGEIPSQTISGSYPTRIFGFWSELGIYTEVPKIEIRPICQPSGSCTTLTCWNSANIRIILVKLIPFRGCLPGVLCGMCNPLPFK